MIVIPIVSSNFLHTILLQFSLISPVLERHPQPDSLLNDLNPFLYSSPFIATTPLGTCTIPINLIPSNLLPFWVIL
jgi:hypothetical protein